MMRNVSVCLDSIKDENTANFNATQVGPTNPNNTAQDLNSAGKQSGICLDPIKYVNPPNQTVTLSLATCPTTTPPLNMASSMANISSSFLQGFM